MRFWPGLMLLVLAGAGCAAPDSATPPVSITPLDDAGSTLRADFNRAQGSVRLIFLVDPICPGCLRGLADMDRDLLSQVADPRLQVFVVHEPVIGAGRDDIPAAAALLHNPHVHHYWNAGGGFGGTFAEAVDLRARGGLAYAWDVWTLYAPDAVWSDNGPPKPMLLMHQLHSIENPEYGRLDSGAFAARVRALLAGTPRIAGTTRP
jgi:hypothetical protein